MVSKEKSLVRRVIAILSVVVLMLALTGCVSTGTGTTTTTTDGTTAAGGGTYTMIIYLVVIVAVFYFLMIRPEKKKRKKAEELRNSLSVGDEITTIGGMVGKVVDINDKFLTFETGEDRVRIQIAKWAVSTTGKVADPDQK